MGILDSRLCDLLGIDKPIALAPMVGYADGALAAAVSEAGGSVPLAPGRSCM